MENTCLQFCMCENRNKDNSLKSKKANILEGSYARHYTTNVKPNILKVNSQSNPETSDQWDMTEDSEDIIVPTYT